MAFISVDVTIQEKKGQFYPKIGLILYMKYAKCEISI